MLSNNFLPNGTTLETTTGFMAPNQSDVLYFRVLTDADRARGRSGAFADAAVKWGARGQVITAEAYAELAEVYARLADILDQQSIAAQGIANAIPFSDSVLYEPSVAA